jgi:hypothetical protein
MNHLTTQIINKLISPTCRMFELHNRLNTYNPKGDLTTNNDLDRIILEPHGSNSQYNFTKNTIQLMKTKT